jgi:hypothetical protein
LPGDIVRATGSVDAAAQAMPMFAAAQAIGRSRRISRRSAVGKWQRAPCLRSTQSPTSAQSINSMVIARVTALAVFCARLSTRLPPTQLQIAPDVGT